MIRKDKIVIFDLDGTLALIDKRRAISTKPNGKLDWDIFFDPSNISLDQPNIPVIKTLQMFIDNGFKIVIFSGRSDKTFNATTEWLMNNKITHLGIDIGGAHLKIVGVDKKGIILFVEYLSC